MLTVGENYSIILDGECGSYVPDRTIPKEKRKLNKMDNISNLAVKLYDINRCFQKIESAAMEKYNLRNTHIIYLLQVKVSADGLTPTEIAEACCIDKAFVSRISTELFEQGFIKYNEKFDDGRKYKRKIVLTESGESLVDEISERVDVAVAKLSDEFSDYEIKNFYRILYSLGDLLDEEANKESR